jgi:hypothetical protein
MNRRVAEPKHRRPTSPLQPTGKSKLHSPLRDLFVHLFKPKPQTARSMTASTAPSQINSPQRTARDDSDLPAHSLVQWLFWWVFLRFFQRDSEVRARHYLTTSQLCECDCGFGLSGKISVCYYAMVWTGSSGANGGEIQCCLLRACGVRA